MRTRKHTRGAGFSLLEVIVAAGILAVVLVGVLGLMQLGAKMTRDQTGIAEMQQSHRSAQNYIVRHIRLAGRGGLPYSLPASATPPAFTGRLLPNGLGVGVRSNVSDTDYISPGDSDTPKVLENTDVVTVRGVIDGSVYQVNPSPQGAPFVLTPDNTDPTAGTITITDPSPRGLPQQLGPLADILNPATPQRPEALLLVSPLPDIFAVVELDRSTSSVDDFENPTTITLGFRIGTPGGTLTADEYLGISPNGVFSDQLRAVAALGIVEEYRFYVREEYSIPGNPASELRPRLTAARYYPGTERPYDDDPTSLTLEIADNIFDLQAALGVDTDGNGQIDEADPPDQNDDWLFNSASDDPGDSSKWNGVNPLAPPQLFYVRMTTVARTPAFDRTFMSEPLTVIEDREYNETAPSNDDERYERSFRRRVHQTLIDLRNL
jgi:type II secretory pathway pseudopilin PulG